MATRLELFRPDIKFKETYLSGLDEMQSDSDQSAWIYLGDSAPRDAPKKDFDQYVQDLLDREHTPPSGWIKDTIYWAMIDDQMVGRISLRHELNDFLRKIGGHIGYIVRPSFRGQGIATEMLRQVLLTKKAKEIGKVLLTCDENNLASQKTILKNNGVFTQLLDVGPERPRKKHFWISL